MKIDSVKIKQLCKKPVGIYDLANCCNNVPKIEYTEKYYSREEIASLIKSIQNNKQ